MAGKTNPPKKRAARPAAERAQEALDVATRVQDSAAKRLAEAQIRVSELEVELAAATKRRDYAAQHPDLPAQVDAEVQLDGGTP